MPDPRGARTRAALLAAAAAALAQEGWRATSRSIARRAGQPVGALNYHFADKEDLLRQAAVAEVAATFSEPAEVMARAATADELVTGLLALHGAPTASERQQLVLLEVMLQSRRDPRLGAMLAEALAGYRAALGAALERVGAADGAGDRDDVAAAFAATLDGLTLHLLIDPAFPAGGASGAAAEAWRAFVAAGPGSRPAAA